MLTAGRPPRGRLYGPVISPLKLIARPMIAARTVSAMDLVPRPMVVLHTQAEAEMAADSRQRGTGTRSFAQRVPVGKDNLDVVIGLSIAGGAGIAGLLGALHTDHLSEAMLGALAVLGLGLVRDRGQRRELTDEVLGVARSADDLERAISALTTEVERSQQSDQYEVLASEATWDIAQSGALVVGSKRRLLRFLRGHQVAVTDYSRIDSGQATDPVVEEPFEYVRTIPDSSGTKHALIALDRAYQAGETVTLRLSREFRDSFLADEESVAHRVDDPTHSITMRVIWPADREPRSVRVWSELDPTLRRQVPLDELTLEDGRKMFTWSSAQPPLRGDRIAIVWLW
jgi:hypothetical protein